jgi:hypothetical protein
VTDREARRLAWSAFALWVVFLLGAVALDLASKPIPHSTSAGENLVFASIPTSFAVVAMLILSRQPRNRIGWILILIGLLWVLPANAVSGSSVREPLPFCGFGLLTNKL